MKCSHFISLLDEESPLTNQEITALEAHAAACESCSVLLEPGEERDEWDLMTQLPDVNVSESFTNDVMAQIHAINKASTKPKRMRSNMGLIAAGIAFALVVGATSSPAVAQMIKSFFAYGFDNLDRAAEMGFADQVQASATDKGITLSVHQVLPDSPIVYITYQVSKDGQVYDPYLRFEGKRGKQNRLYVTDDQGMVYEARANGGSGGRMGSNDYSTVRVDMPYGLEGKQLTLHMEIQVVGGQDEYASESLNISYNEKVEGHWKVSVPFSFGKSEHAKVHIPLNQSNKSPQGVTLNVNKLVLTPTETILGLSHEMTAEAKQRQIEHKPPFWSQLSRDEYIQYDLNTRRFLWQLLDDAGNVISDTNTSELLLGRWPQGKKLTFRLDYEEYNELSDLTLTFRPADVRQGMVIIKINDHEFKLTSFKTEADPRESGKQNAVLEMDLILKAPDYKFGAWMLANESDLLREHLLVESNRNEVEAHQSLQLAGTARMKYTIRIPDYDPSWEDKKLKLIAPIVTKRYYYGDEAWTFPIEIPPTAVPNTTSNSSK
ncbi:DUF4179 domain-containing protein [Paenibacillus sp. UMB4589-SE434]|uniref:DUF4179 domain-containing protein n=1 Tax=Paenibacillus sp. UMB4589-SE434 TaxID=3046314 RepID=UPI00254B38CE|nr:DUF4179 domain-containing protein [Paenibacillus sp. UMB4589-SE434]MDK8183221.1 DUF4179 domain-containing protein [Paenibacillus sp. UMB4589-SE434]